MNPQMIALHDALIAAGANAQKSVTGSDTVFCNGYGIFPALSGADYIQARNVWDKDDRFSIGSLSDPADVLAARFLTEQPNYG